jgi:uncharacterized protein YkwD
MTCLVRTSLLAVFVLLGCHTALAQEAKSQPVARLVSSGPITPSAKRLTVSNASLTTNASPTLAEASAIEKRAFEQTNLVRVQNGLPALRWDADLCRLARAHSENMSELNYFAHTTPDGQRLRDRARAAGILTFKVLAENIAYNQGYDDPGAFAVERWMASEKHRANILSPEFSAMAIGTYVAADGSVFLTQTFITR